MRFFTLSGLLFLMFGSVFLLSGQVPDLESRVPDAAGYEVIYKFSPLTFKDGNYEINNAEKLSSKRLKRIGYLLILKAKADGRETWAFASMKPFTQNLKKVGVPAEYADTWQIYVSQLEVAGNVDGLKTGKFAKGNLEFWIMSWGPANVTNVPGADTASRDFGDQPFGTAKGHGCMQIHNFMEKQTVIAYNVLGGTQWCEVGIGNNTAPGKDPDWYLSGSGKKYETTTFYVVGQFE